MPGRARLRLTDEEGTPLRPDARRSMRRLLRRSESAAVASHAHALRNCVRALFVLLCLLVRAPTAGQDLFKLVADQVKVSPACQARRQAFAAAREEAAARHAAAGGGGAKAKKSKQQKKKGGKKR